MFNLTGGSGNYPKTANLKLSSNYAIYDLCSELYYRNKAGKSCADYDSNKYTDWPSASNYIDSENLEEA